MGARMTGGGFGGCTINLVKVNAVDAFVEQVSKGYQEKMSISPEIYVTEANDGAARVG